MEFDIYRADTVSFPTISGVFVEIRLDLGEPSRIQPSESSSLSEQQFGGDVSVA